MKNADKPIYPINIDRLDQYGTFVVSENIHTGLSKREYFAALAMQGMLSCETHTPHPAHTKKEDAIIVAKYATIYADALLSELEKTESK